MKLIPFPLFTATATVPWGGAGTSSTVPAARPCVPLYPASGAFVCLVVAPAQAEALLPTLSEYTQACWQAVKPMGSGRWLSLEVDSPEVVEDIKTLLMLKRPLKKQGQA